MTEAPDRPHRVLGGYELLRPERSPGSWLARVRDSDGFQRSVVVRVLDPAELVDGRLTQELAERLRLIADRSHPSLMALLDVCRDGDTIFAVMEHVPGSDLEAVARAAPGALPPDVIASIGKDVCLAIEALHGRPGSRAGGPPLVHGAIDGGAIRLSRRGEVRLTVPGLALPASDLPHDPVEDLFSLGLALRPLCGPGTALASVLARATTVHPELRYQNAGAMRLALDQALRSLDPNLSPRERRRRSDALQTRLAALVALAQEREEARGEPGGLIPMDRHDFAPGPGSMFIEVERGEGPSDSPRPGAPVAPVRQRRDRHTLELVPTADQGLHAHAAIPLAAAPGRPAGATLEHLAAGHTPSHDTEETPALWQHIEGDAAAAPPAHVELSDLLVVDAIPRAGEQPAVPPPAPEPPLLSPVPSTRAGYRSESRRMPLLASPLFRLLVVAVVVLVSLLVCLGALLVDRGHRQAAMDALPSASWEVEPGAIPSL